jgi:hypothetical protein
MPQLPGAFFETRWLLRLSLILPGSLHLRGIDQF